MPATTINDDGVVFPDGSIQGSAGPAQTGPTGGMILPSGSTAERNAPQNGEKYLRFNEDLGILELYDGSSWVSAGTLGSTSNGYGTRTVSTSEPTGGADGDIWYVV